MTPSAGPASEAEITGRLVPADLLGADEIIILAIKPSGWYVLTSSLPVVAAVVVVAAGAYAVGLYEPYGPQQAILSLCAAAFLGRILFGCWQWLGRTYVLTNLRVVCVRGLLSVSVTAAALLEVRRVQLAGAVGERLVGVASIHCLTEPEAGPAVVWDTVARPQEVQGIIDEAVRRARRANQPPTMV